ncbi:MAG: hypothetical protein K8E24_012130 [Methanobacterium paludis]|nr:hypothetical protein [Methanobacterium paludis]
MADTQELGISVVADVEQAISDLGNLLDTITSFPQNYQTTIDVNDTDLNEAASHANTLGSDLDSLDSKSVDIDANLGGNAETGIETLQSDSEELSSTPVNLDVNSSDLVTADGDATTLSTDLKDSADNATELETNLSNIDPAPLVDAGNNALDLSQNLTGASDSTKDTSNSMNDVSKSTESVGVAAGFAGLGIGALVSTAVNGAGNVVDQWDEIGGIYHETAAQAQSDWGTAISGITGDTGRGAGDVRGYILGMGIQGVKAKDVIVSSFEAIASASGTTGIPLQGMETTLERVANNGKVGRGTLAALGLTTDDVGMSTADLTKKLQGMTAEQRTNYMTNLIAAKYGAEGNEIYKKSWEHTLAAVSRAGDYMGRILGATILPLVSDGVNLVSDAIGGLAGWIDHLNGPLGTVVKGFIGVGVAGFTLIAIIVALTSAYNVLGIGTALASVRTMGHTAVMGVQKAAMIASALASGEFGTALNLLTGKITLNSGAMTKLTAENGVLTASENKGIIATVRSGAARAATTAYTWAHTAATAALSAATTAYTAVTNGSVLSTVGAGASRVALAAQSVIAATATGILSTATTILNLVMSANPIMLVVIALVALAAGLIWAYNNVKPVHDAVNNFWNMLTGFVGWLTHLDGNGLWSWLWSGILTAGQQIYGFFGGLSNYLQNLPANMQKWGASIILGLINGIVGAIPGLREALSAIGINFPQSPPKEGPLSKVTKEGAEAWTSSIAGAMTTGMNKFSLDSVGGLPKLSSIPSVSNAVTNSQSGQGVVLQINKDAIVIKGNATKDVMENAGTQFGGKALDVLKGLVSNGGKPAVIMRK